MGRMTSTASKNNCGTLLLRLQQAYPCDWQDLTRVAPKTHTSTTAWWMASNWTGVTKFLRSSVSCKDLGPHGPNCKKRLEEELWHLAFTTSTGVPERLTRLGWCPSQANLPLHDGWRRNRKICHSPWDVKSTVRKAELPIHNAKLDCIQNTGAYLQLRSFTFFALHNLYLCSSFRRWQLETSCPKAVILGQPPLL